MDRLQPKVNYLFKPRRDTDDEVTSYCHIKSIQKRDVLLFLLDKTIIAVKLDEHIQETEWEIDKSSLSIQDKLDIHTPYWFVQFKETLKTMCCNHSLGLVLVLDDIGQIWFVKLEDILNSVHDEPMELDDDIFNDQPKDKSLKRKIDIKRNVYLTVDDAVDMISADNVVYVTEQNCDSFNIKVYEIEKEDLSARQKFIVPLDVECSIPKLFLVFHKGAEPLTRNTIKIKEPFYRKMFSNSSNHTLLFGLVNGGIFCLNQSSNDFELICDLKQDLVAMISIDVPKVFVKTDTLFSSQKLNVPGISCECLSLIGKKGRCMTIFFIEEIDQILYLNNQLPRDVVCCTNQNDFLVTASEVDVTIFKVTMTIKDEATVSRKSSLKNGDISMDLQSLQIFDLPFISNLTINSLNESQVMKIIACNTFGKIMQFSCDLENNNVKPSYDIESYNAMTSDLKDLQTTSTKFNQELYSLSNIGHAFQRILRQTDSSDINLDSRIIMVASKKQVLLEVSVYNHYSYTFKSDWFISLHYHNLFDEQDHTVKNYIETYKINCLSSNETSNFNFLINLEYVTYSPLQCDIFLEHVPTSCNKEVKPFSVHLKGCVIDILQFCDIGNENISTVVAETYQRICPENLSETKNYTFSLNLDGNAIRKLQSKTASDRTIFFPLPANGNIVKFMRLTHVNGDKADIQIKLEDNNFGVNVTSNSLLFLVGLHYQFIKEYKNLLIGKSQEELTRVLEDLEEILKKASTAQHQLQSYPENKMPSKLLKQIFHLYLQQRAAISK